MYLIIQWIKQNMLHNIFVFSFFSWSNLVHSSSSLEVNCDFTHGMHLVFVVFQTLTINEGKIFLY